MIHSFVRDLAQNSSRKNIIAPFGFGYTGNVPFIFSNSYRCISYHTNHMLSSRYVRGLVLYRYSRLLHPVEDHYQFAIQRYWRENAHQWAGGRVSSMLQLQPSQPCVWDARSSAACFNGWGLSEWRNQERRGKDLSHSTRSLIQNGHEMLQNRETFELTTKFDPRAIQEVNGMRNGQENVATKYVSHNERNINSNRIYDFFRSTTTQRKSVHG